MKVITGQAKGRRLESPVGTDTRPTSSMAKEAIFSIVQFELEGAVVLDLFAGSGQLGIEALSRGARYAVFVDTAKQSQEIIRKNLQITGLHENARVSQSDAVAFLTGCHDTFDVVFIDPPYQLGLIEKVLPALVEKMSDGGVIVCESERKEDLPEGFGSFTLKREYRYGKSKVTTYRREEK